MPSPLGHALGGIAASWAADLLPGPRAWRTAGRDASFYRRAGGALTLICAGLAAWRRTPTCFCRRIEPPPIA